MTNSFPQSLPAMEIRAIGRTQLAVGVLALGSAPLGGMYATSSSEAAITTVKAARKAGINLFDVAPHYGQGLAEQRLGEGLATLKDTRFVLSTKVGRLLEPGPPESALPNWPEALSFRTVYDVTRAGILRSVADSRRRLGGKRADILLLHDPDKYASGSELTGLISQAYDTLSELRANGEVTAIGIGVNSPEPCRIALDLGQWDCLLLAGSYSVVRQQDDGLLDRCSRQGVSVLIGGPYMSGALAGGTTWRYRPIPPDVAADIARLHSICTLHGVPMQAAALQFPLMQAAVAAVVVGMRSEAEVRQNVDFLRHPIPAEFWLEMAAQHLIAENHRPTMRSGT
jgi:D-threo-aldose 1-dehydrogenase